MSKKRVFQKIRKLISDSDPKVAVINLSGVIGVKSKMDQGINFDNVNPLLEDAFKVKNLKAVAINVNSPGGSPVQSELIFKRIRELSKEKKIPTYTFAQDVAASGGYFILLAGDKIYGHNSSIIGSIGVISAGFGFEELIKKIGVERRVYAQGKNKAVLDPFLPEKEENITILKEAQKDVFESFKELVKSCRGVENLKESDDYLFNGAFWSGKKAMDLGLIDGISDAREILKEKFGTKIKFVEIKAKKKGILKELLASRSNIGADFAQEAVSKIEERAIYSRFGL